MKGGAIGPIIFICMCPGYMPGGTGPMGVGRMPGATPDGPAPSYKKNKCYIDGNNFILTLYA